MDITARTSIALGVGARDLSDIARALVGLVVDDSTKPGGLIATAVAARRQALVVQDRAVLTARAAGSTWVEIASELGLTVDETRARYETTYERWAKAGDTVGFLPNASSATPTYGRVHDDTSEDAVSALDGWRARHTDPWEDPPTAQFETLLAE